MNIKAARSKGKITFKGAFLIFTADLPQENLKARR